MGLDFISRLVLDVAECTVPVKAGLGVVFILVEDDSSLLNLVNAAEDIIWNAFPRNRGLENSGKPQKRVENIV